MYCCNSTTVIFVHISELCKILWWLSIVAHRLSLVAVSGSLGLWFRWEGAESLVAMRELFCCGPRASLVVEHGLYRVHRLSSCAPRVLCLWLRGLSCPEAWGILVSWPGLEPMSPAFFFYWSIVDLHSNSFKSNYIELSTYKQYILMKK